MDDSQIQKLIEGLTEPTCFDWLTLVISVIAIVISGVAIYYAIQVPKKIAEQQNKIALFDRRFEVCYAFKSYRSTYSIYLADFEENKGNEVGFDIFLKLLESVYYKKLEKWEIVKVGGKDPVSVATYLKIRDKMEQTYLLFTNIDIQLTNEVLSHYNEFRKLKDNQNIQDLFSSEKLEEIQKLIALIENEIKLSNPMTKEEHP